MKYEKRNRVKRGFTLIELLVVLCILSIGTLIVSPNIKVYSDKKAEIEFNYAVDGIVELINIGKSYGRLKERTVFIKFSDEKAVLTEGLNIIKEFKFPSSINKVTCSDVIKSVEITGFGQIRKAQSIVVYSKNGFNETITIKVGTSYVSKKK